jgi:outer membrane protein TolC
VQQLAASQLQLSVAGQRLASLSGIEPELGAPKAIEDDLHEEPGLESFQPPAEGTPAVVAAVQARQSAEQQASAQRLQLVPALAGSFTEHASNYPGFSGHDASFQAVLAVNWAIDYSSFAAIRAQDALARAAAARQERASLASRDAIHDAWAAVHAAIARSRSARVQQQVTQHASSLAKDRYQAGASTQLDLLQAERDAFSAEAARIQADADLANARDQLRIAAGRDPLISGGAP